VDYSRYEYQTYNFRWYVEYGNIYIRYSDGTELVIDGYYIRNNHLYGKTYDGSMEVYLTRYDYYDGYLWDDGYYWSRTSVNNSTSVFGMHLQSFNLGWGIFWGPQGWGSRVRAVRSSQN
jgi:hypothetical protein